MPLCMKLISDTHMAQQYDRSSARKRSKVSIGLFIRFTGSSICRSIHSFDAAHRIRTMVRNATGDASEASYLRPWHESCKP